MAARCGTLFAGALPLLLLVLFLYSPALVAGGVCVKTACSKTPYPEFCTGVLSAVPEGKTVADARGLAELAIHACNRIGGAAGTYARSELDAIKDDNVLWQCLDECAEDIEDALGHIDDTEGSIDDLWFSSVGRYLEAAQTDSWSCDESCRDTPDSPVKATVLAKNAAFEKMMSVTNALIKQATAGHSPAPAPAPTKKPWNNSN